MEFICIIVISIIILIVLAIIFDLNVKKIKKYAENNPLDKIAEKYPENIEICKEILKKIGNEKVKVEEDSKSKTSLYIAISDKIIIANVRNSFSRIQTIAHECIHSIQDRKILLFNFIYSNIYLAFFFITIILAIIKLLPDKILFLCIFILMGFVYYVIRAYLENDAMIKARYLAKEYMEEKNMSTQDEIDKLVQGFDELNSMGIKGTNFGLAKDILVKIIILSSIFLIF